jgi:hypothetical protein
MAVAVDDEVYSMKVCFIGILSTEIHSVGAVLCTYFEWLYAKSSIKMICM